MVKEVFRSQRKPAEGFAFSVEAIGQEAWARPRCPLRSEDEEILGNEDHLSLTWKGDLEKLDMAPRKFRKSFMLSVSVPLEAKSCALQ